MNEELQNNELETKENENNELDFKHFDKQSDTVNLNLGFIMECAFYLAGIAFLIFAIKWYGKDLSIYSGNPFRFSEHSYVGGDAYNYIISAARSSAVVGKSIFWVILAGTSFICGRLTAISRVKKCK